MHLTGVQLALRASVAAAIAVFIAGLLKFDNPIYAFIAAVIVTDLSPQISRQLGLRRIISTIIGAIIGAALSQTLPAGPLSVGVSTLSAMLICQILRVSEGAKVAGYICGLIVLYASADPWSYAFFRCIETMIGVVVAWGISYVPKLIRLEQTSQVP
jgi:uncharacterized membrane protein YgaE (UPF0421/DUF939 family)